MADLVLHLSPAGPLSAEDSAALGTWFTALFDSGSEGIEDTILRCVSFPLVCVVGLTGLG